MHPSWEIRNLKRRVTKARKFPHNTCPASRHVQMMGEYLGKKPKKDDGRLRYVMLAEEPEHCAGSILATVAALYEARTDLCRLAHALYAGDASKENLALALKIMKRHGWPHDGENASN